MAIHYMESAALRTDLDRGQKLVLMCFGNSANDENRVGFPGFDALTTWSSLGRSQLYNVISQLVDLGLLVKVRDGGRGRRAEYAVFPRGECCPLHGPLPGYEAGSDVEVDDAGSDPSDPGPDLRVSEGGSDPSDPQPAVQGPTMGPTMGPIATGPLTGYPATDTHSEGVSLVSSGDGEQPPLDAPDGTHRTCPEHRVIPAPGPCTPCGTYRRAWERAEAAADAEIAAQARQMVEEQRQHERRARELADAEVRSCVLCDRTGRLSSGLTCLHDPDRNPRPDAGGYAEFQRLRAKGVARSTDGRDPEKGRRRARAERTA